LDLVLLLPFSIFPRHDGCATFEEENRSSFVGFLAFLVKLEMPNGVKTITIKIMKIKR
jgi:hypothetical protein